MDESQMSRFPAPAVLFDVAGINAQEDIVALTPREREVLLLLAYRQTDREIAARLCISRRTVETHVARILAKLDVPNRRDAAFAALALGLLA